MLIEAILDEINQVSKFTRRPIIGNLMDSLVAKIGLLTLTTAEAMLLSSHIEGISSFDTIQRERLLVAVDTTLTNQLTDSPVEGDPAVKTQHLLNCCGYITAQIEADLSSHTITISTKVQIVSDFLVRCGCNHPHEQTYKWWLAMLVRLHFDNSWPTYKAIFSLLTDMKQCVDVSRKRFPFPSLRHYPKSPHDLPPAMFTHIYGTELPAPIVIARLSMTASKYIPLRKNSKLLADERTGPLDELNSMPNVPAWLQSLARLASSHGCDQADTEDHRRPVIRDDDRNRDAQRDALLAALRPRRSAPAGLRMHDTQSSADGYAYLCDSATSPPQAKRPSPSKSPLLAITDADRDASTTDVVKDPPPSDADDELPPAEHPPSAEPKVPPPSDAGDELPPAAPDTSDVLRYEAAVITALKRRDGKRKEVKKEKAKAIAAAKKAAKALTVAASGGEATATKKEEAKRTRLTKKSAPQVQYEPDTALKETDPPRPSTSGSVHYNGGTIYSSFPRKMFRVIRTAKVYATERASPWGGDAPTDAAWAHALALINNARAEEHAAKKLKVE